MKFWLIVFLFNTNGEFVAKDTYEAASYEQCESFAGDYAKAYINTKMMVQLHCVSDGHYNGRNQDKNVDFD